MFKTNKARLWGGIATLAFIVTLSTLNHTSMAHAQSTIPAPRIGAQYTEQANAATPLADCYDNLTGQSFHVDFPGTLAGVNIDLAGAESTAWFIGTRSPTPKLLYGDGDPVSGATFTNTLPVTGIITGTAPLLSPDVEYWLLVCESQSPFPDEHRAVTWASVDPGGYTAGTAGHGAWNTAWVTDTADLRFSVSVTPALQLFLPYVAGALDAVVAATVRFVQMDGGTPSANHEFSITTRCPGYILSSTTAADAAGNWAGDIPVPVGCSVTLEDSSGNSVAVVIGQGEYTLVTQQ